MSRPYTLKKGSPCWAAVEVAAAMNTVPGASLPEKPHTSWGRRSSRHITSKGYDHALATLITAPTFCARNCSCARRASCALPTASSASTHRTGSPSP